MSRGGAEGKILSSRPLTVCGAGHWTRSQDPRDHELSRKEKADTQHTELPRRPGINCFYIAAWKET